MTDTTMARFIAELINGGDWDDPNYYTEEQKELWRKHAAVIEEHARKRLLNLAQGSIRLPNGRVVPAGMIARNGKLVCDGESEENAE